MIASLKNATRRESTLSSQTSDDFSLKEVLNIKVFDDKEMTWGLRSKSGAMRGFQKGITLGGRISGRVNLVG